MGGDSEARGGWSARFAFIAAASGSAVGLGNIWRFPYLSYTYGGGAFFVPYLLCMVFIGIPILTLEFALGQVYRSGDVASFGAMHPRLRGVGLGSIWCGFMVVCYYVVIIAFACTYLVSSFHDSGDHFKWAPNGDISKVSSFFVSDVAGIGPDLDENGNLRRSVTLVPQTWAAVTVIWVLIYLCTFKGARLTGRITYLTFPLPLLLLLFLACYFGGLNGADEGIEKYIGDWDMKKITSDEACGLRTCEEAWVDAVTQVFFSLSVTFGVMTAYASYNPRTQGVQMDAFIVAFFDCLSSFIGGFAVYAGLGVLAKAQNQELTEATAGIGGFSLVFISFPSALEALGHEPFNFDIGWQKVLAVLFWLTIITLGIDSAFSLLEGFSTCMKDSRIFKDVPREALIGLICLIGYTISTEYCNDTGVTALDTVDYYITVSMLFVGFLECISAGWVYMAKEQAEKVGWNAWGTVFAGLILSSIVGPRVGFGIARFSSHASDGTLVGLAMGVLFFAASVFFGFKQARVQRQGDSAKDILYDLLFLNIETLRTDINKATGSGNIPIPFLWSIFIKFVIPPVLMLMLQLRFISPSFGDYSGYHQYYQGWGLFIGFVPWAVFALGLFAPTLYDNLMPESEVKMQDLLAHGYEKAEGGSPNDPQAPQTAGEA